MALDLTYDYDYKSKTDLLKIRQGLRDLGVSSKAMILSFVLYKNLMNMPWTLKLIMKFFVWRKGIAHGLSDFANFLLVPNMQKTITEPMWEQTMQHMITGEDRYDSKSAGGWCEEELKYFLVVARTCIVESGK